MSSKGRGRKVELNRGLPSVAKHGEIPLEPPCGLERLAGEFWRLIVAANPDIPAARSVSLGLLCSQLAELSRLRGEANSVDVLNMVDRHLDGLIELLAYTDMSQEERLQKADLRLALVARRDSAVKRIAAEQALVVSITRLEEQLGLDSIKVEDAGKVTLAMLVDEGDFLSGDDDIEGV